MQLRSSYTRWCFHVIAFSAADNDGKLWLAIGSRGGNRSKAEKVGLIALGPEGAENSKVRLLTGHTSKVELVAFSLTGNDGRLWLASGAADGKLGLIAIGPDGPEGEELQLLSGHKSFGYFYSAIVFSARDDNQLLWLVSSLSDSEKVGIVAIGKNGPEDDKIRLLEGHTEHVLYLAFSAHLSKGRFYLASASQHEVILWSIPDGKPHAFASFSGTGECIHEIRWSDDNRKLYVAGSRGKTSVNLTLIVPDSFLSLRELSA